MRVVGIVIGLIFFALSAFGFYVVSNGREKREVLCDEYNTCPPNNLNLSVKFGIGVNFALGIFIIAHGFQLHSAITETEKKTKERHVAVYYTTTLTNFAIMIIAKVWIIWIYSISDKYYYKTFYPNLLLVCKFELSMLIFVSVAYMTSYVYLHKKTSKHPGWKWSNQSPIGKEMTVV